LADFAYFLTPATETVDKLSMIAFGFESLVGWEEGED
jgi:hypothetical protein